jgi:hypothetical protein
LYVSAGRGDAGSGSFIEEGSPSSTGGVTYRSYALDFDPPLGKWTHVEVTGDMSSSTPTLVVTIDGVPALRHAISWAVPTSGVTLHVGAAYYAQSIVSPASLRFDNIVLDYR